MKTLSHLDQQSNARMVNVGQKKTQSRYARAEGHISLGPETIDLVRKSLIKKGDVLAIAEFAGIQASKQTALLIPLCHNIPLDQVKVYASLDEQGVHVESEAFSAGKTGVEMEALTAVSLALLTVYDMCKAVDKDMVISGIRLLEKTKTDLPDEYENH